MRCEVLVGFSGASGQFLNRWSEIGKSLYRVPQPYRNILLEDISDAVRSRVDTFLCCIPERGH